MREQEEVLKTLSAAAGIGYAFQTTIAPQNSGDSGEGGSGDPPPSDPGGGGGNPPPPGDSGEGGSGNPPPSPPPS